ncbi:Putative heme iron utilization protein [Pseudoalteromonas luteoviolacea B = ATCC 29581]|nr:Putative heme iron utilization protein [Pseudoalteromonas luteoviolacea B = ATCC 29581]
MRKQAIEEAKALLDNSEIGVLSTHSNNMKGYPFGSMVQLLSLDNGNLALFISDLAQHTKNLNQDPRLSITVLDKQQLGTANAPRITLVGNAQQLKRSDSSDIITAFCDKFIDAQQYAELGDFHIWEIEIERIRFIGGFGKIFWLEKAEWYA